MKTPHEFYLETDGKVIDVDKSYGGQCWDLFALFCQEYCNYVFGCPFTGYVADLWYHFHELHLDCYFEQITDRHQLQDGDWLIWDKTTNPLCWISNSSHIAMFRKYNDDNPEQNIILSQNPGCTRQYVADFLGFVGALRPKCYIHEDKSLPIPVEEDKSKNQFRINCANTMNIRLDHTTSAESIGFGKTGYYNTDPVNMVSQDGYQWYEIEKGKWCALLEPYSEFVGVEEESPQNNENKGEKNDPYEIEIHNKDKKNPLIEFIKYILKLLAKIIERGSGDAKQ